MRVATKLFLFALSSLLFQCRSTQPQVAADPVVETPVSPLIWSTERRHASASFYYLVAEYKALSGDIDESRKLFESSYNLDPNPFVAAKLIATNALSQRSEEAETDARRMVLLYPANARLRFLYAQVLTRMGRYTEAIKEVESAIDLDADSEDQYLFLADLYQILKQPLKATVILKEYLAKHSASVPALSRLAKIYLSNTQKKEALQVAEKAYELDPTQLEVVLIMALALDANGKSDRAVALYEQLYRANPSSQDLIVRMAEIYRNLGNPRESLELLNELAKLPQVNQAMLQMQRAILLWDLGEIAQARQIFEELAKADPQSARLQYLAGLSAARMDDHEAALLWLKAISEKDDIYRDAQLRIAMIYRQLKRFQDSAAILDQLLKEKDPVNDVFAIRAALYADDEEYTDALSLVKKAQQRFPDEGRFLFLEAAYLERLDRFQETQKVLRKLIAREPKNSAALNFLGYYMAEKNVNLDEAEKLIRQALEIKPKDPYYLDSLAWVYFQRGEYDKAKELLTQVLKETPDEGVVYEHYADVLLKLGKKEEAREFYRQALEKNLEKKDKQRIEKKAKDLS